ncbi:MAG TPA: aminoglycoside phosphotransferase family protein [Candidatus Limnocylindrales bacterium]|nr:aminoglycoside phosphotransferase family protein [Candidatus Limnocylindrales bacterium]
MSLVDLEPLDGLLHRHGLGGATEEAFPNDGWSGAAMTRLRNGDGRAYILKRDSLERDWIARATADRPVPREAWFAAHGPALPWPVRAPYLGAGWDDSAHEAGILMPDLSSVLFDWNSTLTVEQLDRVIDALAVLHSHPWGPALDASAAHWTPWQERLTLICRPSLERAGPAREAVADRLLPGWDAWDRLATPTARAVIADLAADPGPLLDALAREPATLLHGDLKLANVGIAADGAVELVDWQMVMVAPVAVELGWFLVSNVNALPEPAGDVLARYWTRRSMDGARQDDLTILVGLLIRGWRKGADAVAGVTLASGVSAADDLAWWCERAVEAADRIL